LALNNEWRPYKV